MEGLFSRFTFHVLRFTHHVPRFTLHTLLIVIWLLPACGGGIRLIDLPKSAAALNLSAEQQKVIQPKIELIGDIVEDYEFEKKELEVDYLRYRSLLSLSQVSRYEGGGPNAATGRERNEMRTKFRKFVTQRRKYAQEIAGLIDEIKANLTPEQLVLFEGLKRPELELPDALNRHLYDELGTIPGTRWGRPGDF